VPDPDNEAYFKQWRHHSPDAYQPYLAFALYNYERGLKSRGTDWAGETSEAQFKGMRHFFSESLRNIDQALALHPDLLIAYPVLIGIYNCDGEDVLENRTIKHGMALFPSSSLVLFSAMWSKQPRWGGSYSQMEALMKKAEAHIDVNPSLGALYGLIYLDQARTYRNRKKYQEAIDLLNKALSFGGLCIIYGDLARIYGFDLKDYDRALEYVNRSIELRPTKADGYRLRSIICLAREQYDESKADLERAMLINPVDPDIIGWKEKASNIIMHEGHKQFKGDHHGAIEKYTLSLEFDEENVDAYFWRGRAHYDLKAFDAALMDFQSAIAIDPRHFESYRMIDYILARDRQWETIIAYWNDYISLVPDRAEAYYERSGTHYHNKDMERALEDLKQACDLGNKDACKRYEDWTQKRFTSP
jgi:tetratricopeptide (TPR) repeat protein